MKKVSKTSTIRVVVGSLLIAASPFIAYLTPQWLTHFFCQPKQWSWSSKITDIEILPCYQFDFWFAVTGLVIPLLIGLATIPWRPAKTTTAKDTLRSRKKS